jgi:hypothetical protein
MKKGYHFLVFLGFVARMNLLLSCFLMDKFFFKKKNLNKKTKKKKKIKAIVLETHL